MIFTNLFYLNLLAKTIIIEGELFTQLRIRIQNCPPVQRGTSNFVAEGVYITHATVSNSYPLRVLPLAQEGELFHSVQNCPSVYRGTRGKASEGVYIIHAIFPNSYPATPYSLLLKRENYFTAFNTVPLKKRDERSGGSSTTHGMAMQSHTYRVYFASFIRYTITGKWSL